MIEESRYDRRKGRIAREEKQPPHSEVMSAGDFGIGLGCEYKHGPMD
jgi:hypothetical protein